MPKVTMKEPRLKTSRKQTRNPKFGTIWRKLKKFKLPKGIADLSASIVQGTT
jgi:hypothetical protein